MVTLVQQQQAPDGHQKEQGGANDAVASVESHAVDNFRGEVARATKETAVAVPSNGSVGGSSTQCSDIEDEDDDDEEEEETEVEEGGGWVTKLSVPATIVQQHQAVATANGDVVLPNADPSNFGDVCVKNSANVHLGNKTFYKGPVTIKQFVYTNPTPIQDADKLEAGCASDANVSDELSTSKSDAAANRSILPQGTELDKGNCQSMLYNELLKSVLFSLLTFAFSLSSLLSKYIGIHASFKYRKHKAMRLEKTSCTFLDL